MDNAQEKVVLVVEEAEVGGSPVCLEGLLPTLDYQPSRLEDPSSAPRGTKRSRIKSQLI